LPDRVFIVHVNRPLCNTHLCEVPAEDVLELDEVEDGPGSAAEQEHGHDEEQNLALIGLVNLGSTKW
jgi:hypothetical protein